MRWSGERQSSNIEDRRGMSGGGKFAVGGGFIGIIVLLISLFTGRDLTGLMDIIPTDGIEQTTTSAERGPRADDETAEFVSVVLASTEDVWGKIFSEDMGASYQAPRLVMFDQATQSGCGGARRIRSCEPGVFRRLLSPGWCILRRWPAEKGTRSLSANFRP